MDMLASLYLAILLQQPIPKNTSGPLTPFSQILTEKGVCLTRECLLAALNSDDDSVKVRAAYQLAQNRDMTAKEPIEHALSAEKDPRIQVNLASALASMHDNVGVAKLVSICNDGNLSKDTIVAAANNLIMVGGVSDCADSLLKLSIQTTGAQDLSIISLLASAYANVTRNQQNVIMHQLAIALQENSPSVRIFAGDAIATCKASSGIEILQQAISTEKDKVVLFLLQQDLHNLEKQLVSPDWNPILSRPPKD